MFVCIIIGTLGLRYITWLNITYSWSKFGPLPDNGFHFSVTEWYGGNLGRHSMHQSKSISFGTNMKRDLKSAIGEPARLTDRNTTEG